MLLPAEAPSGNAVTWQERCVCLLSISSGGNGGGGEGDGIGDSG